MNGTVQYPLPHALLACIDSGEPTCSQAVKHPEWHHAMHEEINALFCNQTWSLVPPRPSQNIVGSKWTFIVKRYPDGSIERYKARLVTEGF